ncbi:hypothetical protein OsI_07796 [Oryza sativa Indica Group]|uniref:Uncharacterized protein n=1 Tax=Oryza sativa subsp. indica TaxID=39946 RepID=B8AED0_ORYSI|nr:hypothetical protein OsI_07796 [Oryza sativa Indica Group]
MCQPAVVKIVARIYYYSPTWRAAVARPRVVRVRHRPCQRAPWRCRAEQIERHGGIKSWSILSAVSGLTVMVAVYWGRHIGADPVPGSGWVDDVGLLGAQGGRGRDDPVTGGEERGIEGGAEGVVLVDPLVACNGGGEGRANGVDTLDMVEVRGVDGGDQHPHAHIAVADLCRRQPSHPEDFVGAGRGDRRGRLWWAGT